MERDVIFISLVDTAERGALSLRDQNFSSKRFNVAASRPGSDVDRASLSRTMI